MNKTYGRINWENYPSDETPLNERNLNKIDVATDEIDNRVITLDTTKATKEEVSTLVQDVTFEEKTGIITIVKKNGSKITIDTQMEKIAVNFSYNAGTQQIILTLIDGTKQYIDLAALITQYEFLDSDTVAFSIDSAGKVSAIVKEASIKEKHLQPNYLADIKVETAKAVASQKAAAASESNAKTSETNSKNNANNASASATKAQSYAVGGTNSRAGENTDNAKYYSQQAAEKQNIATSNANTAILKANEAAKSAEAAKISENVTMQNAATATEKAKIANESANSASAAAATAESNATKSKNYAVGNTESAKYYYEKAKEAVGGAVTGVKGNAESTYRTGNVNLTPDNIGALPSNGNAASAAKLATARNINGAKFDGTSDIQLPLYYSYSFGVTQNAIYYSSFCRMKKDNVTSECETTLLLSATGNFGGTIPGTYIISTSNRGQKATMTVVCLQKSSQADVTFGYYSDDTYFYFGVIRPVFSYSTNLTVLSKSASAETGKFLNSTTKPKNWVDVAITNSIGGNASTVNGHTVNADVPANAKFTDTNTTYSAGTGIGLSNTTFYNAGVRSIATGSTNGSVAVNTNGTVADVKVKGLNTLAYASGTWNKLTGTNCTLWYNEVVVYLEISAQGVNLTEYGGTATNKTIVVLPTNVTPTKGIYLGVIVALNSAWVPLNKLVLCNINYNTRNVTLRPTEALSNVVLNLTAMFPRSLFTIT